MKLGDNTKILINGIEIPSENFQDTDIEFFIGDKQNNKYHIEIEVESGSEVDIRLRKMCNG